jgi:hypothetical protein
MVRARHCALVAAALLAGGCGGGAGKDKPGSTATAPPTATQPKAGPNPLDPPPTVPQQATGRAEAESARVIRGWSRTLRRGDVEKAARYFALPSKFQNATPVLTIDIPAERIAINEALPCGAVPIKLGSAGAFTIVTFKLVKRSGGVCGAAVGATARTAIRVAGGQIREWYRLPDAPGGNGSQEPDGSTPVV